MLRMDNPPLGQADLAPSLMGPMPKQHASRLHISLVTAIIVVMVFGVGALFSCCYHWGWRLQHNQTQRSGGMPDQSNLSNYVLEDPAATIPEHVTPQTTDAQKAQEMKQMYTMQVLMPGDDVPKFIAWSAPHRNPPVLDPTVV
ncbi:unnamed protein product [Sphagnum compactum]